MIQKERKVWLDIFKGILIICVIIGHEISAFRFVYWFHMPLFFLISGYLFRPSTELTQWIKQKFFRFMIPYFSFYVLITLVGLNSRFSVGQFCRLLYGGRQNSNIVGVWWFPTCLFLTILLMQFIVRIKKKSRQLIIVMACYALAIVESLVYLPPDVNTYTFYHKFPWNIDVVFAAILFVWIGYIGRTFIDTILNLTKLKKSIIFWGACGSIILMCILFKIDSNSFSVDMKYSRYGNPIFFILFPVLFGLVILIISDILSNIKFLAVFLKLCGHHSMTIMYLHVPLLYVFRDNLGVVETEIQVLVCIFTLAVCLISGFILDRFKFTRAMFITGNLEYKKSN